MGAFCAVRTNWSSSYDKRVLYDIYDIAASESGFAMQYTPFEAPLERSFDDVFFGEWLEEPVAFGAFEGEKLLGYAEGSPESWNNRFRISNIC